MIVESEDKNEMFKIETNIKSGWIKLIYMVSVESNIM